MLNTLYTIGYSGFELEDFFDMLKKHGIQVLIDVRSNPFSSYFSSYNKDSLEIALRAHHMHYRNYSKEFGAQQSEQRYFTPEGYLDFKFFSQSECFKQGYRRVEEGLRQNYVFALMCAEKDPIDCHRAIMVSKVFSDNGYAVLHLLPEKEPISQHEIEQRLLAKYFPNRDQISLFEEQKSEDELIAEVYRRRNADIGYQLEEVSK